MPPANQEFAHAVREVLRWLNCSADAAGAELGIRTQTMNAMCSGIVPMRSLVIRFASEVSRRAEARGGAPAWWTDVDMWLAVAGYPPRRDLAPRGRRPAPAAPTESPSSDPAPVAVEPAPVPVASPPHQDACGDEPAAEHYRPVYERMPLGDSYVHIFWLLDRNDSRTHQFRYPAEYDYVREASRLKQDLRSMTKAAFERRYSGYRLEPES